jgi:hypothetical protein
MTLGLQDIVRGVGNVAFSLARGANCRPAKPGLHL